MHQVKFSNVHFLYCICQNDACPALDWILRSFVPRPCVNTSRRTSSPPNRFVFSEGAHRKMETIHRFRTNPQGLHNTLLPFFAPSCLEYLSGLSVLRAVAVH
jgi:hypothetical protein